MLVTRVKLTKKPLNVEHQSIVYAGKGISEDSNERRRNSYTAVSQIPPTPTDLRAGQVTIWPGQETKFSWTGPIK